MNLNCLDLMPSCIRKLLPNEKICLSENLEKSIAPTLSKYFLPIARPHRPNLYFFFQDKSHELNKFVRHGTKLSIIILWV